MDIYSRSEVAILTNKVVLPKIGREESHSPPSGDALDTVRQRVALNPRMQEGHAFSTPISPDRREEQAFEGLNKVNS